MNFAPFPFSLSKDTVPPMASVNLLTTGKPKPCPSDFVVNKGVKILSLISSEMPTPLSAMLITALSSWQKAATLVFRLWVLLERHLKYATSSLLPCRVNQKLS
jgi:hypothetical protein